MEKVQLYIGGEKADLDDVSFILYNYTMEDTENPTIVKNSFTKQITLKGTANNNRIFGHLYKSDRVTIFSSSYTGCEFDAMRKTPFELKTNGGVTTIESGYIKMDSISIKNGVIEYKITLYGGVGAVLYRLMYDSEGNKRTLKSLMLKSGYLPAFNLNKDSLCIMWNYFNSGETSGRDDISDILNFAPCYNGFPSDFDSDKAIVNDADFIPFREKDMSQDGYTIKSGCSGMLVTFSDKHTEWEMRNLMSYQQRPIVRFSAILEAIIQEGGVLVDKDVYSLPLYTKAWVTLPLLKKEAKNVASVTDIILDSSLTPCDYLLAFVKMCGLVIVGGSDSVLIQRRDTFFQEGDIIDLTGKIDGESIEITPLLTSYKWYQFGNEVKGELAESYKEKYGKDYGSQTIDTGYEFNAETNKLTKNMKVVGGVEVAERGAYYASCVDTSSQEDVHPIAVFGEVKRQLFKGSNSKEFSSQFPLAEIWAWTNPVYTDWLPKVQFHTADNKSSAGEHCFLFYDGWQECVAQNGREVKYYVADDHPDIERLNGGTPCWNLDWSLNNIIYGLPSFRRVTIDDTLDWGIPLETYSGRSLIGVQSLYDKYWKNYLTDRYHVDTKVMKCKVNLLGMIVNQSLMKNFFFYDNALWVLNKINNYSLTTEDLTECEFIKVNNIDNYKNGQS